MRLTGHIDLKMWNFVDWGVGNQIHRSPFTPNSLQCARTVFSCVPELAKRVPAAKESQPKGVVGEAVVSKIFLF